MRAVWRAAAGRVEQFAAELARQQKDRERTVARLKGGQLDILVATDVAARGLDIDALGAVIAYELPRDPDVHLHRIGLCVGEHQLVAIFPRYGKACRVVGAVGELDAFARGQARAAARAIHQRGHVGMAAGGHGGYHHLAWAGNLGSVRVGERVAQAMVEVLDRVSAVLVFQLFRQLVYIVHRHTRLFEVGFPNAVRAHHLLGAFAPGAG